MLPKIPSFEEVNYTDFKVNRYTRAVNICQAEESAFDAYCHLLEESGFTYLEGRNERTFRYGAYRKGMCGVFINYFRNLRELNITIDENCNYFDYENKPGAPCVSTQITQLYLVEFGMSYVIRLSDGRFIIIDGGADHDQDVEALMKCLKKSTPHEKPVIAAWILTHMHLDHYYCMIEFLDRYSQDVKIEGVFLNFPEGEAFEHFPELIKVRENPLNQPAARLERLIKHIVDLQLPCYAPHCGQTYHIGEASCEILSCTDITMHQDVRINPTSIAMRMELAGQVIMWMGDLYIASTHFHERYEDYLKADILQLPHHGFGIGKLPPAIPCFDYVAPKVCLMPVSYEIGYSNFSAHNIHIRHAILNLGIEELIVGEPQRTITMPYKAPFWAKEELLRNYRYGMQSSGASVWFFGELNTAREEDFEFSFANMTYRPTEVNCEMFFHEKKDVVRNFKLEIPGNTYQKKHILLRDVIDENGETVTENVLGERVLPENATFCVRFKCNHPIVITHASHKADYHTTDVI